MATPVSVAVKLVGELVSRVKDVKTNHEGCRLLGSSAEQVLGIMRQLDGRPFEASMEKALELVNDALRVAQDTVDACCNTNFITAMLYKQNLSLELKHAAQRLEHALSLVCLSSIEMTSETQSKLVDLSVTLRNAKFEARATQAHLIKDLKDAFESASYQVRKEREDVKNLVQQLVREQASTHDDLQELLAMLKEDSKEARENKEKQMELEIDEVIAAIVESLKNSNHMAKLTHNMKIALRCPITHDLMQDPVMVQESGMIYDRSSIMEWFNRGHFEDPLTNLTLKSRELVSDHTVRNLLESLHGEPRSSSIVASQPNSQTEVSTPCLQPGLYEGHGKFTFGSDTILAFQLLILEPDGNAIGYTLYKKENAINQRNSLEIGKGEWMSYTLKLVYEDICFFFFGKCDCEISDELSRLRWRGNVSKRGGEEQKAEFVFLYTPPPIFRMIWPAPGMIELEGVVTAPQTQIKYDNKVVLSITDDFNVNGWMLFKSTSQEPSYSGRIAGGNWNSNGCISFSVLFPPKGVVPNSWTKPTNMVSIFEIDGKIEKRGDSFQYSFYANVAKKESDMELQKDESPSTPLNDLTSLDFHVIRVTSSCWGLFHTKALQDFQITKNHEANSHQCTFEERVDINFGCTQYYLRTKGWTLLHVAAKNNQYDVVEELIAKGANIDCHDKYGETPLHVASCNNAADVVKELIIKCANIECHDPFTRTPLYVASRNGSLEVVKELIVNGANIERQNKLGWTPLYVASRNNHNEVVEELTNMGANTKLQENDGQGLLHIASRDNAVDVVRELLRDGADIECQDVDGCTPLHNAASNNAIDVVKDLVANGVNIEFQNKNGFTPLYVASEYNAIDVVKELIANGANIERQDENGLTPLYVASKNNCNDVVKELTANGANIECQDKNGWTPLYVATKNNCIDVELLANDANTECQDKDGWTPLYVATKNNRIDVLKELIANGANIECRDWFGKTPLHVASRYNYIDVVKELISNGANIECRDNTGKTPLYVASENDRIDVLKELIANGANIECRDNDGKTPLYVASENDRIDVLKELIANGANIECRDKDGKTPLYVASRYNYIDVVKELIANGANIECQDKDGLTPLHVGSSRGYIPIVKMLLEHGASKSIKTRNGMTPFNVICSIRHFGPYNEDTIQELEALLKIE